MYESVNGGAFGSTPVATVGSGVTTASITGLSASNDYAFEVAAFDSNGDSYVSNPADAADPPAVTVDSATALLDLNGNASITLNWTPGTGTPSGATYNVYEASVDVMPTSPLATGITATSFTDSSIAAGQTGYFWVTVTDGGAASSATGFRGVAVSSQYGTVDYLTPVSVQVGATERLNPNYASDTVTPHPFDTSLGTELGMAASLTFTDTGFLDAPGGGSAVTNLGHNYRMETQSPNYYPAYHHSKITTASLTAPPSTGNYVIGGYICVTGDPDLPQEALAALVGFLDVTYTYATPPAVTTPPANQTEGGGYAATFHAVASGLPTPSVQWQKSTDGGTTWTQIAGATSTTYGFTVAPADNGSEYEAIFTNPAGTVTSSPASLTVPVVVNSVVINGDNSALAGVQRSMVNSIAYTFSEPVTLAATNAFTIAVHSGQTGTAPTLNWSAVSPDGNGASAEWVVSFSGAGVTPGGSIADGVYDVTLNTAAVTSEANPTTGVTGRPTDTFYRLFGDAQGTRGVNSSDYNAFESTYALKSTDPGYLAYFADDGTGKIDSADYNAFEANYGTRLSGFTPTI